MFQKCLFQLIERLTVLQRRKRELARESVKLQTKVANSLRSAVEKNFLTMIFFGKNKTFDVFFFRKGKIDATVAFPHLSGMSNEEAKKEYEKIIGFVVTIFIQYAIGQGKLQ